MDKTPIYAFYAGIIALMATANTTAQPVNPAGGYILLAGIIMLIVGAMVLLLTSALAWSSLLIYLINFRDQNWKKITTISIAYLTTLLLATILITPFSPIYHRYTAEIIPELSGNQALIYPLIIAALNILYIPFIAAYIFVKRKDDRYNKITNLLSGIKDFIAGFLLSIIVGLICFLLSGFQGLILSPFLILTLAIYFFLKKRKSLSLGISSVLGISLLLLINYWIYIPLVLFYFILITPWFGLGIYLLFFRDENWKKITTILVVLFGFFILSSFYPLISLLSEEIFGPGIWRSAQLFSSIMLGLNLLYSILLAVYVVNKRKPEKHDFSTGFLSSMVAGLILLAILLERHNSGSLKYTYISSGLLIYLLILAAFIVYFLNKKRNFTLGILLTFLFILGVFLFTASGYVDLKSNDEKIEEAVEKQDPTLCEDINNRIYKDTCYHDLGVCEKVRDKNKRYKCEAITKKDPTICENISNYLRDDCYHEIALSTHNPSLCNKLEYHKESCFLEIAKAKQDTSICESINDHWWRNKCYLEVAITKKT